MTRQDVTMSYSTSVDTGAGSSYRLPAELQNQFHTTLHNTRVYAANVKNLEGAYRQEVDENAMRGQPTIGSEIGMKLIQTTKYLLDQYVTWQNLCKQVPAEYAHLIQKYDPTDIIEGAGISEDTAKSHSQMFPQ